MAQPVIRYVIKTSFFYISSWELPLLLQILLHKYLGEFCYNLAK